MLQQAHVNHLLARFNQAQKRIIENTFPSKSIIIRFRISPSS
uniref:Uncharacterized protein n=1 Tax=Arundo donax TaxID=35708 RepID=A0A0A9G0M8_ARUDO